jgi:hypothetical protein
VAVVSNSDERQGGGNVGDDDVGGGGYNHGNKEWTLWDENNHDFYMIPLRVSSGYKPPRRRQMPVFYVIF